MDQRDKDRREAVREGMNGPAWSSARRMISTWSAAVFEPAFPGRSTSAAHSPPPSGPWSNHAVSGWWPNPFLKVGAAPSLSECTLTKAASTSITNGRFAETPAVGECSPARAHTRCRTVLRARLTAASTASTWSARAPISRETVGSEATGPKTSFSHRSSERSDRHRPPRATHTARSKMILPGSCTDPGRRHGNKAPQSSSPRPVTPLVSVSSLTPASPTAGTSPDSTPTTGYNPIFFTTKVSFPWSSRISATRIIPGEATPSPRPQHPNNENLRLTKAA